MFGSILTVAGASPARADSKMPIDVDNIAELVADRVHQRFFTFGTHYPAKVLATSYGGAELGSYSHAKASDIVLAPDSSVLYVALRDEHKIVALDPMTMKVVAEYDLGAGIVPTQLNVVGKRVWFLHSTGDGAVVGSLDLSGATPVSGLVPNAGKWSPAWSARLTTGPTGRMVVTAADEYVSFDVRDGVPVVVSRLPVNDENGLRAVELMPDGERYAAVTWDGSLTTRRFSDHADVRILAGKLNSFAALDVAEDGAIAIAAADGVSSEPRSVRTFAAGTGAPIAEYGVVFRAAALAWEPGDGRLFAIDQRIAESGAALHLLDRPRMYQTGLYPDGPKTAKRASPVTITASLKSTPVVPAGTSVSVTRVDIESPAGRSVGTATTDAGGVARFTDVPLVGGAVWYKFEYAGSATHEPALGWQRVDVSRTTPAL
ncbi:hypothetical protein MB27_30850, partial [Actinoplanes utahensis]